MAYASKYYDPVKAHEYYMKHRQLRGRKSTTGLNSTGKEAAKFVKDKLQEERKAKMAENRAINSKKPARSAFMRWARAHKGAFVINDPELKAQLAYSE